MWVTKWSLLMKHAAIYYRVSTDRQELSSQINAVENWLEALPDEKKPQKITVFKDEGKSGKTMDRQQLQQMLDLAFAKKIDAIICYRLDRISRDATAAIKLLLTLGEAKVAFFSVTQPVLNMDDNPFHRTMLAAFAEIAQIERETIVARVRAGLDAAKRRGVKLGAPTKVSQAVQTRARSLKVGGLSYKAIAAELNLSVGTVHKLVKGADLNQSPENEAVS